MTIRVAVQGTSSKYSQRWLEYCQENGIDHAMVDCYESDIIQKLKGFAAEEISARGLRGNQRA